MATSDAQTKREVAAGWTETEVDEAWARVHDQRNWRIQFHHRGTAGMARETMVVSGAAPEPIAGLIQRAYFVLDDEGGVRFVRMEFVAEPELIPLAQISVRSMQALRLGRVYEVVEKMLPVLSDEWAVGWRRMRKRPGRRGSDDSVYLDWARRKVDAQAHSPRSPVKWLAEANDEPRTKIDYYLHHARTDRGLLEPDGAGGERLTEKALRLLEGISHGID